MEELYSETYLKAKPSQKALNGENRAYNTVFCVGLC